MLVVAAADDSGDLATIIAAAASLGLDPAALDTAESLGLLELAEGRLEFRHPLVRSAIYQTAPASTRRAAHAALADVLSGDWQADRRAWHRAAGAVRPDEQIAAELEAMASNARARSGYAAAARALERAAQLTPDPGTRAGRMLAAADALWHAGRGAHAEALLADALERSSDPLLRANAQHLRGRIVHFRGDPLRARALLVEEGLRAAPHDRRLAADMLASAFHSAKSAAIAPWWRRRRRRRRSSRRGRPRPRPAARGVRRRRVGRVWPPRGRRTLSPAVDRGSRGVRGRRCRPLPARFRGQQPRLAGRVPGRPRPGRPRSCHRPRAGRSRRDGLCRRNPLGVGMGARRIRARRSRRQTRPGASAARPSSLRSRPGAHGTWRQSRASVASAIAVSATSSRRRVSESCLWCNGIDGVDTVLGALDLAEGDAEAAIARLEAGVDLGATQADYTPWHLGAADLVEAYVRTGRSTSAARAVETLAAHARQQWELAALARGRGLVAGEHEFDKHFQASAEGYASLRVPFDEARSRLCYGERLRRDGRRLQAREQLRSALATFERLRTEPWAERTRAELRASGETLRARRDTAALDELTPQELQVALTVAAGADQQGGRCAALPLREDDRGASAPDVPQARHPVTGRARTAACRQESARAQLTVAPVARDWLARAVQAEEDHMQAVTDDGVRSPTRARARDRPTCSSCTVGQLGRYFDATIEHLDLTRLRAITFDLRGHRRSIRRRTATRSSGSRPTRSPSPTPMARASSSSSDSA